MYDVCVIGGGAAGICASISAAKNGATVCVIDRNKKPCKKIYATGNGHCNLTNEFMDYNTCYHSHDKKYTAWLTEALGKAPKEQILTYFNQLGIATVEKNGYYYPMSKQASSVAWSLLDAAREHSVDIMEHTEITSIHRSRDTFTLNVNQKTLQCKKLILACGGKSAPGLGGTSSGYELAASLGLKLTPLRPSLCGLVTRENMENLKGVRVDACASLYQAKTCLAKETGELQFTEYGLSGIMIFNLSSVAGSALEKNEPVTITLDFLKGINEEEFQAIGYSNQSRSYLAFLNAFLPDKLAVYLLHGLKINPKDSLDTGHPEILRSLYQACRGLKLTITSLCDFEQAQVTAGGVKLQQVNPVTMESRQIPGLYVVGELLDIDGKCGGYNLTFAFLTGKKAGEQSTC